MNSALKLIAHAHSEGASRYQLGVPIATGGMAVIRRGFDRWAQREVAHKRLRLDREDNRSRMNALFQREYDTLARLKHPNIVEVYDYGFDELGPYYAMELLSGDDLAKVAPLPYRDACRILRDIASALALVHARRLVHRDVSPNNVRLTTTGVAKLIDFGALTPFGRPSEIAGTPSFIAPECLREAALDQRTDLYSLGALAYWTITGRRAVASSTIGDLERAWQDPLVPPSSYVGELPDGLNELIISLLQHDPDRRPSSAAEVIERLSTLAELGPEQNEGQVAYSYLEHPPLVGRAEALNELRTALHQSLDGHGAVVVVEAATGLGKSALFDQFAVDAQLRGATVLRAEGTSEAAKLDVARRLIHLGTRIFPDLEGSEAFRLNRLDSSDATSERARHPVEALERNMRAAGKVREMLLRLSVRSPLVILLDDAHLADDESIGLLASMVSELQELPILLLMSRHGGSEHVRSHAYEQLTASARQLTLHSLEEAEVVELVASMFGSVPNSGRMGVWLHSQTGGNPAQCVDLLRLLLQRGSVRYTRGTFTLPHDIDLAAGQERRVGGLLARTSGLSQDARRIFELICLHHGSLPQAQLASASRLSARRVLIAVEELVHRELAFLQGSEVSLRGESLRTVIEQSLADEPKQALHRALASAVAEHADDSLTSNLERARHLFRAGPAGELAAAELMASLLTTHGHVVSISASSVPLLEAALTAFRARGFSELHCAPLLAALAMNGFYSDLALQEKYLRPALRALSQRCGFTLAGRLRPKLGAKLAMLIGLVYAIVLGFFLPRRLGRRSIKQRVEDFCAVMSSGIAAAAVMADSDTAAEIVAFLAPCDGFPARSAVGYAREFCLATAELIRGETVSASRRYGRLLKIVARPVFLLEEPLRKQLTLACLNGKAQADVEQGSEETLRLADELEQKSAFFAAHAETARMAYHAIRGHHQLAEQHRTRSEMLALRGGASWAAAACLTLRSLEPAFLLHDAVGLVRAVAELERFAKHAPGLQKLKNLALAQLALVRGVPNEAVALLSATLAKQSEHVPAHQSLLRTYAHALNHLGKFAEARAVCHELLARTAPEELRDTTALRWAHLPLAHAEGALGHFESARQMLQELLVDAAGRQNPLEIGMLHAELARLATRNLDVQAFDLHHAAMVESFQATGTPSLLRQCDALLSRAISTGMKPHVPDGLIWTRGSDEGLATAIESRPLSRKSAGIVIG